MSCCCIFASSNDRSWTMVCSQEAPLRQSRNHEKNVDLNYYFFHFIPMVIVDQGKSRDAGSIRPPPTISIWKEDPSQQPTQYDRSYHPFHKKIGLPFKSHVPGSWVPCCHCLQYSKLGVFVLRLKESMGMLVIFFFNEVWCIGVVVLSADKQRRHAMNQYNTNRDLSL